MQRVFHVDQECYVIFLEDFEGTKDRFVRIGNSPFFKKFGDQLTFLNLLTSILPGDPFLEADIFRPQVDKVFIGLRKYVQEHLNHLKTNNLDTNKIKLIYAEEKSKIVVTKTNEEDFLKDIKDNTRLRNHSFASFYSDGNIRIFNKENVIFDLKDSLDKNFDEYKEINYLNEYYKNYYDNSYKKSGIIHSNNSLFIFSNNKFVCIAGSPSWVKDALRLGINPLNIDILYIADKMQPDSIAFKIFTAKSQNQKKSKTNIIFRNKDLSWDLVFPSKVFSALYSDKNNINLKLPNINISFIKDKIKISYKNINLSLDYDENFLKNGYIIDGKYSKNNANINFNLIVEEFKKDHLTIYSNNPVIFEDNLNNTEYISNFWKKIPEKSKKDFEAMILKPDAKYFDDFKLSLANTDNFYSKLFTETLRRIIVEDNPKITDYEFENYIDILKNFSGEEINKNKILLEQYLGYTSKGQKIGIRDILIKNDLQYIDDKVNPFLSFEKEFENFEWMDLFKKYKEYHKKNIDDQKISSLINDRFNKIISSKKFHIEEQDKLLRFLNKVIIKEGGTEIKFEPAESKTIKDTAINDTASDSKNEKNKMSEKIKYYKYKGDRQKGNIKIPIIAALISLLIIILLAILLGLYFKPQLLTYINNKHPKIMTFLKKNNIIKDGNIDNKDITQDEWIKKNLDKYSTLNKENGKKSVHYKFYVTILDVWNLTNIVAIDNGYYGLDVYYKKEMLGKKDPDFIYPDNILRMPDATTITVKNGDTMWGLSETYLIDEINKHEIIIRDYIEQTKLNKITIQDAQNEFKKIKSQSHSQILKDFLTTLISLQSFEHWEPYLKEKMEK